MSASNPSTQKDYASRVLRVLVHIQENLSEPLRLEELAVIAHFSPFHFHRVFRGLVGESVKQYVRRLRLERAAAQLQNGKRPILEIALDAGYETHESFTRAFRGALNCAPSEFRAAAVRLIQIGSPDQVHHTEGGEIQFTPKTYDPKTMKIEIRHVESLHVAFLRHVGPYEQVGGTWERLCSWAGPKGLLGRDTRMFGASYDDPDVTPADKLRFDACITVSSDVSAEGDVGIQTLGGADFAVALHKGPYERLAETYAQIFGGWFANSEHEPGDAPCLEFYLNDPMSTAPEDLLTEICVPLQKALA